MSNAGAGVAPSRSARLAAADGVAYGWVTVETITAPSWEASMPAFCRASRAAPSAMSMTLTSAGARWRVMMPVRWRIHSSEESIHWQTSSLVTMTSGR